MSNAWHDVFYGKKAPKEINAVIEVPKDSKLKYELDKETGLIKLDRVLYPAMHYPGDYGFIPQTLWDDGDPLDILIISNFPVYPNTIVKARPIGLIQMSDEKESDDKIIAVHASDPRFKGINSRKDLPEHLLTEITHFFKRYKELQNKKVKIINVKGRQHAFKQIKKGIEKYKNEFGDKIKWK